MESEDEREGPRAAMGMTRDEVKVKGASDALLQVKDWSPFDGFRETVLKTRILQ